MCVNYSRICNATIVLIHLAACTLVLLLGAHLFYLVRERSRSCLIFIHLWEATGDLMSMLRLWVRDMRSHLKQIITCSTIVLTQTDNMGSDCQDSWKMVPTPLKKFVTSLKLSKQLKDDSPSAKIVLNLCQYLVHHLSWGSLGANDQGCYDEANIFYGFPHT